MISVELVGNLKSISKEKKFELPDFCIITGKNGSGKSQLFEALSKNKVAKVSIDGKVIRDSQIRYITFKDLVSNIQTKCSSTEIAEKKKELIQYLSFIVRDAEEKLYMHYTLESDINYNQNLLGQALENIAKKLNKDKKELTEDDINNYFEYSELDYNDIFKRNFAGIFKCYYNNLLDYLGKESYSRKRVVSDTEQMDRFGPKPWNLLNEILDNLGLPYKVNSPEGTERDSEFHISLKDTEKNIQINPSNLSDGEKVIMSLATAIYNEKNSIKYKLLLIDEPDAPLHPSYSKILLETLKKHIVENAGIKVIMTTHSPTTVALADEDSLYEKERGKSKPRKISKDEAISVLSQSIPYLRVSIDQAKVVFVESKYDAENYTKLFGLVNSIVPQDIQPTFHPANNSNGSNSSDVVAIISKLQDINNVYGLIDYDGKNKKDGKLIVAGDRYAIENYIFDPIFVGLILLHDDFWIDKMDETFPFKRYSEFGSANPTDIQKMIDWVIDELGIGGDKKTYSTISGDDFIINSEWKTIDGHKLEDKIVNHWPKMKSVSKCETSESGNLLKRHMLNTVIKDYPQYLSHDYITIFNEFK